MKMQVHTAPQGSDAWLAERAQRLNAGDAAAMLGCDPNRSRLELLDSLVRGFAEDVGAFKQRIFDKGHAIEAQTRPLAEGIVGEDLYPIVGSIEVAGLTRRLGASFDGLTMARIKGFECKSLNEALAAALPREDDPDANDAAALPKGYRVQMEQQLMVSGAQRILFCAAAFNADGSTKSLRCCWYESDPALRAEIIAGWKQFEADLAAHTLPIDVEVKPVGRAPDSLPALRIEVTGMVTASNLVEFKETALAAIRGVNRSLTTDEHFADAEKAVKWCSDVEDRLAAAKQHALSQTASIDELFRVMDDIGAEARGTRLELDKLVKARKLALKGEIVQEAQAALIKHVRGLNARLGGDYLPTAQADFAGAIHGKKSFASMRAALNATLANAKIEASASADCIGVNLTHLRTHAADFGALFPDVNAIVHKPAEDFRALVDNRIHTHQAAEQRRAEELAERERAKVRAQEEARARETVEAERRAEARRAHEATEAARPAQPPAASPVASPAVISQAPAANASNVLPIRDTGATIRLGQVCDFFGFTLTAERLASLGYQPVATDKNAKLYRECDLDLMAEAIKADITTRQAKRLQAA